MATPPPQRPPILVLGLGNDLMGDDALGPTVVRELRQRMSHPAIRFQVTAESGLRLLDHLEGHHYLLVMDVLEHPSHAPGTLLEYPLEGLPSRTMAMSLHGMGLKEVLETGRTLGLTVPKEGRILVVVARELRTVGAPMSPEVARAVPRVVRRAQEVLTQWLKNASSWNRAS